MEISVERLNEIVENAAMCGAHKALSLAGVPVQEYYSRADLSRKFGRGKINRMISAGKLTPYKLDEDGKAKYSISQVLSYII